MTCAIRAFDDDTLNDEMAIWQNDKKMILQYFITRLERDEGGKKTKRKQTQIVRNHAALGAVQLDRCFDF